MKDREPRPAPGGWRRWLAFALCAGGILAAGPVANDVQKWISSRFGAGSLRLALTALILALTVALGSWLVRRRLGASYRRLLWLLALAAATLALTWGLEIEAERAHLAAYGLLGALAFRALAVRLPDGGVYPAAAALVALAGTLDEVVQWLLPNRFWGLSDVGLNAAAGVLAQLLIWKVVRPPGIAAAVGARSARLALRLIACEAALLALCLANTPARIEWYGKRIPGLGYLGQERATRMTEYGHLYADPEIGRFRSRLDRDELRRADAERGAAAAGILERLGRPLSYDDFQRTYRPSLDPFVFEAGGHLFFRKLHSGRLAGTSDPVRQRRLATIAFRENLILERYYPHLLASSSLALSPARRRRLEELNLPDAGFESEVSNWVITGFSEARARWSLLALLAGLLWADRLLSRRLRREAAGGADRR